jgi:hypothetical protein
MAFDGRLIKTYDLFEVVSNESKRISARHNNQKITVRHELRRMKRHVVRSKPTKNLIDCLWGDCAISSLISANGKLKIHYNSECFSKYAVILWEQARTTWFVVVRVRSNWDYQFGRKPSLLQRQNRIWISTVHSITYNDPVRDIEQWVVHSNRRHSQSPEYSNNNGRVATERLLTKHQFKMSQVKTFRPSQKRTLNWPLCVWTIEMRVCRLHPGAYRLWS